jgi:hypothetical protein
MRTTLVASLLLFACGSDTSSGPAPAACQLVGAEVALPAARNFELVAAGDHYELLLGEAEGTASYTVDPSTGALGPRVALSLSKDGELHAVDGEETWASTVFSAAFAGLPLAQKGTEGWTITRSPEAVQDRTFTYGSDLVRAPDGALYVVWLGASGLESDLLFARFEPDAAEPFTYGVIPTAPLALGVEVAATFDAAGDLHVVFDADQDDTAGLFAVTLAANTTTWSAPRRLGDIDGTYQGQRILSATSTANGTYAVAVMPASFFDKVVGGLRVFALAGSGPTTLRGPNDDRPVVEGVDTAALSDGRLLVSATWGENNLDAADSDDAAVLYACTATSCGLALTVDGTNGTFFGRARIATRGLDGAIVYSAEPKGGNSVERTVLRRFTCPTP